MRRQLNKVTLPNWIIILGISSSLLVSLLPSPTNGVRNNKPAEVEDLDGVSPDIAAKMFETDEYKDLIKKYPTLQDQRIIRKLSLVDAQVIQRVIDNVDNKEIVVEAFTLDDEVTACAGVLYGIDGVMMLMKNSDVSKYTSERKYLVLKASKHDAFKIIEMPKLSKKECMEKFGN